MCSALDGATVRSEKSTNAQSVESTQRTLTTLERQAAAVVELRVAPTRSKNVHNVSVKHAVCSSDACFGSRGWCAGGLWVGRSESISTRSGPLVQASVCGLSLRLRLSRSGALAHSAHCCSRGSNDGGVTLRVPGLGVAQWRPRRRLVRVRLLLVRKLDRRFGT